MAARAEAVLAAGMVGRHAGPPDHPDAGATDLVAGRALLTPLNEVRNLRRAIRAGDERQRQGERQAASRQQGEVTTRHLVTSDIGHPFRYRKAIYRYRSPVSRLRPRRA